MKFKKNLFLFLFLFFILILFLKTGFVFAREIPIFEGIDLPQLIIKTFNWLVAGASILSVLVIVLGGLHYLVSFGMGKITSEGKEWVKAGVLGLIIVLSSYLILWTINPDLIKLKMVGLIPVPVLTIDTPGPLSDPIPTTTYNEIPIGTLTESLLTRTTACYDFDQNGDPIDGDPKTNVYEPTFMDHDRVDCLLKLGQAIEKKAKIFNGLSEKIAELMKSCTCFGICDLNCTTCSYSGSCPLSPEYVGTNTRCQGDCVSATCKGDKDCCPPGVKEKIEHGPITLKSYPENSGKDYKGLDEFRTSLTTISPFVEEKVEINKKKVIVIKKEEWGKLKLVEQLMYLKEKLSKLKEEFESDLNNLKSAENQLTNCYAPKPYLELLKIIETTPEKELKIAIQKNFKDPVTKKDVDISKYCKGFGYSDSTCYQSCQRICPGVNERSLGLFRNCDLSNTTCLKNAFYTCPDGSKFQTCLDGCKTQCKKDCDNKKPWPDDLKTCNDKCDNDSACLIKNDSKCYVNFENIKKCADLRECTGTTQRCESDAECNTALNQKCDRISYDKFEICAKKSSSCKYCTDQYAGYSDCLKEPVQKSEPYSSLYLYQNPTRHKDYLSSFIATTMGKTIVPPVYPESQKCPFFSKCPQCPCKDNKCTKLEEKCLFCGTDCIDFAYNDDPLTFYCRGTWALEVPPTGRGWTCSKADEVPVGQTVDETEDWAEKLIKAINDFAEKTEKMVEYIKKIGKEKNYCKCDSKCDGSEKPCKGDCIFWQQEVPVYDENGEQIGTRWVCGCNTQPCNGNPCQKMINLLLGKKADDKCPKGIEYKGVRWYYEEIKKALEKLKEIEQNRSEILKKLIYSRKKMNEGSALIAEFGPQVKELLGCRSAYLGTYILKKRCYGVLEGLVRNPPETLLDNWFFCSILVR